MHDFQHSNFSNVFSDQRQNLQSLLKSHLQQTGQNIVSQQSSQYEMLQQQEAQLKLQLIQNTQSNNYLKKFLLMDQLNDLQKNKNREIERSIQSQLQKQQLQYNPQQQQQLPSQNNQMVYSPQYRRTLSYNNNSNNAISLVNGNSNFNQNNNNNNNNFNQLKKSNNPNPSTSIITAFPPNLYSHQIDYQHGRNPETYLPEEGFKIYLDYVTGLPFSLKYLKVKYGIFKKGDKIQLKNSEKPYFSEKETFKTSRVKIGEKMHLMNVHPSQTSFFYCEFWSLRLNPMSDVMDYKPRGWTLHEIFGVRDIIEIGKFKLPFYSVDAKPDFLLAGTAIPYLHENCTLTIRVCLPLDRMLDNDNVVFKEGEYMISEIHLQPLSEVSVMHFQNQKERKMSRDSLFDENVKRQKYGEKSLDQQQQEKDTEQELLESLDFNKLKQKRMQELDKFLQRKSDQKNPEMSETNKQKSEKSVIMNDRISRLKSQQTVSQSLIASSFLIKKQTMNSNKNISLSNNRISKIARQSKMGSVQSIQLISKFMDNANKNNNSNINMDQISEQESFEVDDENEGKTQGESDINNSSQQQVKDPRLQKREARDIKSLEQFSLLAKIQKQNDKQQQQASQSHIPLSQNVSSQRMLSIQSIQNNKIQQLQLNKIGSTRSINQKQKIAGAPIFDENQIIQESAENSEQSEEQEKKTVTKNNRGTDKQKQKQNENIEESDEEEEDEDEE